MHILLFHQKDQSKVLNIFYGENDTFINKYVNEYIQHYTQKHNYTNTTVEITQDENNEKYTIYHHITTLKTGFFFNSHSVTTEELFNIQILPFDETQFIENISQENSSLWKDINQMINNKILKQLDQESLYQVFLKMGSSIHTKLHWTATELIQLQNTILKDFKKDLYITDDFYIR